MPDEVWYLVLGEIHESKDMDNSQKEEAAEPHDRPWEEAPWNNGWQTFWFGASTAAISIILLCIGVANAGTTLETAVRALSLTAGILTLIGAIARFVAHFYSSGWSKQLDASGKLFAITAALTAVLILFNYGTNPAG
jgi:hypothetical protein